MPKTILMCPPEFFSAQASTPIDYALAAKQWRNLYRLYTDELGWDVRIIEAEKNMPDMVFTTFFGMIVDSTVVLPSSNHLSEPDLQKFTSWFQSVGYQQIITPEHVWGGERDSLLWNDTLFAGYPWLSDRLSHQELSDALQLKVVSLELVDERFKDVSSALTVIDATTIAIYPKAFSELSLEILYQLVPDVIEASEGDAVSGGLNTISDGEHIVISENSKFLQQEYRDRSFMVHPVDVSEFQKVGGGIKSLSLELRT